MIIRFSCFKLPFVYLAEKVSERDVGSRLHVGQLFVALSFVGNALNHLFRAGVHDVARNGNIVKSQHLDGNRRSCALDAPALVVEHSTDFSYNRSRDDRVSYAQRAVFY